MNAAARNVANTRSIWKRIWLSARGLSIASGLSWSCLSSSFAETIELRYAENFTIERHPAHQLITVRNPWRGAGETRFRYALVPRDSELPELPGNVSIIRTPAERLATLGTVYLAHVQALGLYSQLIGVAHAKYASDMAVHRQLESGYTKAIPAEGTLDIERLLSLEADLILTSAVGDPQHDAHPALSRARQPVAVTAGYMETHPLGRAEWIKFTAAFFGKEAIADRIFREIADRYEELVRLTASVDTRPTVLANAPFAGVWHVPGGNSFTSRSIRDAGGVYLYESIGSAGGVPMDLEQIFYKAIDADIWIHPGQARSLVELRAMDSRFSRFEAYQSKRVYNNSKRIGPNGGNDAWERGVLHPEEMLMDLISIFHPELLPDHELIYYERLK